MSKDVKAPLIGADPEFFLFDIEEGHNVSAHGLVPGNKEKPFKVKQGAVQLDGTAVEFNIDPTDDPKVFSSNIETVLAELRKMVPNKYRFEFKPVVTYPPDYFDQGVPKDSKELGCNPDFRSDNLKVLVKNQLPQHAEENPFRTASGHIHIGWCEGKDALKDPDHSFDTMIISNVLDRILGNVRWYWDTDQNRHKLYGMHGAYRPKPYGVEFRGLSNAWLNYPVLWPWLHQVVTETYLGMVDGTVTRNKAQSGLVWSGISGNQLRYARSQDQKRQMIDRGMQYIFGKRVAPVPKIDLVM